MGKERHTWQSLGLLVLLAGQGMLSAQSNQPSTPTVHVVDAPVVGGFACEPFHFASPTGFSMPAPSPLSPAWCVAEDSNGNLLAGDPYLEPPEFPRPGWFTGLETLLLKPRVRNDVVGLVPFNGASTLVYIPQTRLDWTVAPRLEIGYRLPEGLGEFSFGYRFLASDGERNRDFQGIGPLTRRVESRLDLNVFDLDYSSREFFLGPDWDLKWRLGARLATSYLDQKSHSFLLLQRTSNHFVGAGPHFGVDVWRSLHFGGTAVYGRVEGATVVGRVTQSFEQTVLPALGGAAQQRGSQTVPMLNLQAGLSWVPPLQGNWLRFAVGYQYEHWWHLGRVDVSNAEFSGHGLFLRVECGF
jgi:hypothetical protein